MALNYTPLQNDTREQLFPHSRKFEEGASQIRAGQATIVVALDGSGDCDKVEEAIKRIPSSGGNIYIKEGTYEITSKLQITFNNVHIYGAGKATILDFSTSGDVNMSLSSSDYVIISNLTLKQSAGTYNLFSSGNSYTYFKDLWIEGGSSGGVYIESSGTGFRVQNCLFSDISGVALHAENSQQAVITGNIFKDIGRHGIEGASIEKSTISNNIFDTITNDGVRLIFASCDGNTVTNNIFISITDNAVAIDSAGATKNIIVANSMVGNSVSDSGTGTIIANNAT